MSAELARRQIWAGKIRVPRAGVRDEPWFDLGVELSEFIEHLADEGVRLATTAGRVDWDTPVPRTDWNVRELVTQVGGVHRWATDVVCTGAKASDIIREALAAYLAGAVSSGEKGASRTRRAGAVVGAKAARARTPAKAVPAVAAKRVSASATTARTWSGAVAKRPAK